MVRDTTQTVKDCELAWDEHVSMIASSIAQQWATENARR